jgi:tight adherence protein B
MRYAAAGVAATLFTSAILAFATVASGLPGKSTRSSRQFPNRLPLRLALGASTASLVVVATGWPVAGLWMGALGFAAPSLIGVGARRREEVTRIEAIATWAEMLRDQAAAGSDLVHAVQVSAGHAPPAIAQPVARLAIRLRRQPPDEALQAFADEVADPTGDLLARALTVALTGQARRVGDVLSSLADSARDQSSMRMRIERDRARVRTVARSTGGVVLGWTFIVYAVSGRFFASYSSAEGQLVLVLVGGLFALGLMGLARLDRLPGTAARRAP